MKDKMAMILIAVLALVAGIEIDRCVFMPELIDMRAQDLNLMQYDGQKDRFEPKDSAEWHGYYIYYLKNGSMKGY